MRIQRAKDKEQLVQLLVKGDKSIFKEIWQLMIFAALIGWKNNKRLPLAEVDSGKGIDETVFSNNASWPGLLNLLSLVDSNGDIGVLSSNENAVRARIQLFEEYANGGLEIIENTLESSSYSLESFLNFLISETVETQSNVISWDSISI